MKKTRFLILALVVAVMLMGAGYAWWNDTITVKSTVTTGTLDVDIVGSDKCFDPYVGVDIAYDNGSDVLDKDCATIKFTNLYPNAGGTAILTLQNNGSIPVKLDKDLSFTIDKLDEGVWGTWDDQAVNIEYTPKLGDKVLFQWDNNSYTYAGAAITINPGDTATFKLTAKLPAGYEYDNQLQGRDSIGFTINPNFIQFNQP